VDLIRPDQGMALLYPGDGPPPGPGPVTSGGYPSPYGTPAPPASGPEEAGAEPGLGVDIMARIAVCLDTVGAAARDLAIARDRERLDWEDCHPIDIAPVSMGAAGIITDERWQPRKGWAWQVLLITVVFGAGGTSAQLFKSADASGAVPSNALHNFLPDANGWASWEPKGLILLPGQQLLTSAAGSGATVRGQAVEIALHRLPDYLM
jgi:hypothetical protein